MTKNIGWIFGSLVLAVLVFFGVQLHEKSQNTADHVTQSFVQDLEAGQTNLAYARLTASLKQNREQYCREFLDHFKGHAATLVTQERVDDTLNAYPKDSDPQRFVYKFQQQDASYSLSIVTYKVQDVWVIGELLSNSSR
jgi:hypothetical protein